MRSFALMDRRRRRFGDLLDAMGFGAAEAPWTEIARWKGARLRGYGPPDAGQPALVVPAPIKRAYIWDLEPTRSVIRVLLEAGLGPFLVEWTEDLEGGLVDAVALVGRSVESIIAEAGGPVILLGHSLGGTLAALAATVHPRAVARLVLLESPLRFGAEAGAFAPYALAAPDLPAGLVELGGPIPGSLLNAFSVAADPASYGLLPAFDSLASAPDPGLLATHLRVRRWMLDEFAMPARLFRDVLIDLYRDDRFYDGTLVVDGYRRGPTDVTAPILAIVNPFNPDVPPASTLRFLERTPDRSHAVLRYVGEFGVALQHAGVLVGANAHMALWPRIVAWLGQTADPRNTRSPRAAQTQPSLRPGARVAR